MDTNHIETLLAGMSPIASKHFMGCFPADRIPQKVLIRRYPASMVINLDPVRKEGSHWVAAFIPNASTIYYFDSLAMEPSGHIADFLKTFSHVEKNIHVYQNPFSTFCGHYTIAFLYHLSHGYTFSQFIKLLDSHVPNSDHFVQKFVNKLIK